MKNETIDTQVMESEITVWLTSGHTKQLSDDVWK